MNELRLHVERIVRPIVASTHRKNRMREELLRHLTTAFDEALEEACADPSRRAIERLGGPAALRSELQETVPRWERLLSANVIFRPLTAMEAAMGSPEDDRHLRLATRAGLSVAALTLPLLLLIGVGLRIHEPDKNTTELVTTMLPIFCLAAAAFSASTYLFRRTGAHRMTDVSCPAPAWVKAGLVSAHIIVSLSLFLGTVGVTLTSLAVNLPRLTGALASMACEPLLYLIAPLGFAALVYAMAQERRQYEAWGHLDIDS